MTSEPAGPHEPATTSGAGPVPRDAGHRAPSEPPAAAGAPTDPPADSAFEHPAGGSDEPTIQTTPATNPPAEPADPPRADPADDPVAAEPGPAGFGPPEGHEPPADSAPPGSAPPPGSTPPGSAPPPGWAPPPGSTPPPGDTPPRGYAGSAFPLRHGLVRPRRGRYVAGVCAAIGRATNTDPVLWRVLLAVLGIFGGIGILLYLALWLITPAEGDSASPVEGLLGRGRSSTSPVLVIILGMLLALAFGLIVTDAFRAALLGAAVVIGGALLLNRQADGRGRPSPLVPHPAGFGPPTAGPYPAATPAGPVPSTDPVAGSAYGAASGPVPAAAYPTEPKAAPTLWTSTDAPAGPYPPTVPLPPPAPQAYAADAPAHPSTAAYPADVRSSQGHPSAPGAAYPPPYAAGPTVAVPPGTPTGGYRPPFAPRGPYAGAGHPPAVPPVPPVPPATKPPKERSGLVAATFSMVFVALGAVAVLDLSNAADVGPSAYFAGALGVVALGLLVGAWFGRARWLIALGLVLSVALGIATAAESWNRVGNVGSDVVWRHDTIDELANRYENNFGNSVLDISRVDFTGQDRRVTVEVNFGSLEVILPPEVDATVVATLGAGKADVLDQEWSGVDRPDRTVTDLGPDGAGGGEVELVIEVNAGDVEVHR